MLQASCCVNRKDFAAGLDSRQRQELRRRSLCCLQAETATIDQLGTARKITIRANETTIIADAANKEEINIRVAQVHRCALVLSAHLCLKVWV